jgi:hypothetical protein
LENGQPLCIFHLHLCHPHTASRMLSPKGSSAQATLCSKPLWSSGLCDSTLLKPLNTFQQPWAALPGSFPAPHLHSCLIKFLPSSKHTPPPAGLPFDPYSVFPESLSLLSD